MTHRAPALLMLSALGGCATSPVVRGHSLVHEHPVTMVCVAPTGTRVLTGTEDGKLHLWDLLASSPDAVASDGMSKGSWPTCGVFTPKSDCALVGWSNGELSWHEVQADGTLSQLGGWREQPPEPNARITALAMARDGRRAVAALFPGKLVEIGCEGRAVQCNSRPIDTLEVRALVISGDTTYAGGMAGDLHVLPKGMPVECGQPMQDMVQMHDGTVISGGGTSLWRYDPSSGVPKTLEFGAPGKGAIRHVAVSWDREHLACCDAQTVVVLAIAEKNFQPIWQHDYQGEIHCLALAVGCVLVGRGNEVLVRDLADKAGAEP